tara:strand:+ start:196 stop:549 length:354 start_codon:yes stop_codon:yes gene_type:complete
LVEVEHLALLPLLVEMVQFQVFQQYHLLAVVEVEVVIHLVMYLMLLVEMVDLAVVEDLQGVLLIQEEQVTLLQLLPLKDKMEEQAVTLVVGLHQVLEAELEQPAQLEHLDLHQVLLV